MAKKPKTYKQRKKAKELAWARCVKGSEMLELLGRCGGEPDSDKRRKLILCLYDAVGPTVKSCVPINEHRPLLALEFAWGWAVGKQGADVDGLRKAGENARAANGRDARDPETYHAYAAAEIAGDVCCAAYAPLPDGFELLTVGHYSWIAAWNAVHVARGATEKQIAETVRRHYPKPPKRIWMRCLRKVA